MELHGLNFGETLATVSFNGVAAQQVGMWSDRLVRVQVPPNASSGDDRIIRGVTESTGKPFALSPSLASVYPREVVAGNPVFLTGSNFGDKNDSQTGVYFGEQLRRASNVPNWQDTTAAPLVDASAAPGLHQVRVGHAGNASRAQPVRVWSEPDSIADATMLAMEASPVDGTLLALYHAEQNNQVALYAVRMKRDSSTWESKVELDSALKGTSSFFADVDIDPNGTTHICWIRRNRIGATHSATLSYRQISSTGALQSRVELKQRTGGTVAVPMENCKIAVAKTSISSPAVLVVWTEGHWGSTTERSRLYGRGSVNGGATFGAIKEICPDNDCTTKFEGLHDISGINATSYGGWHLVYARKSGVDGPVDLRVSWSGIGHNADNAFGFSTSRKVKSGISSSQLSVPVLARASGFFGFNSVSRSFLAWREGETAWLAEVGDGFLADDLDPARFLFVDSAVNSIGRPSLSGTSQGDLSLVLIGNANAEELFHYVVRHHRVRLQDAKPPVVEGGHEIAGISARAGSLLTAGGGEGRVAVAWHGTPGASTSWSRLPYVEAQMTTIVPKPTGNAVIVSPQAIVSAGGDIHTVFWEEAPGWPDNALVLRAVDDATGRVVTLGAGSSADSCWDSNVCRSLVATASLPDGKPAVLYAIPNPGQQVLSLCVDVMNCTPVSVAAGSFSNVAMAADDYGALHLVYDGPSGGLLYRRWTEADGLGSAVAVNESPNDAMPTGASTQPVVVATPSGTAFVFYSRSYGLHTLRVRSIMALKTSRTSADRYDYIRSLPTELAASSSKLSGFSAAWGENGIELVWALGGRAVMKGSWLDGWLKEPATLVDDAGFDRVTMATDARGQVFVYLDNRSEYAWDTYFAGLDVDRNMSRRSHFGRLTNIMRDSTSVAVDPRGRLVLHGASTLNENGALYRAILHANE